MSTGLESLVIIEYALKICQGKNLSCSINFQQLSKHEKNLEMKMIMENWEVLDVIDFTFLNGLFVGAVC